MKTASRQCVKESNYLEYSSSLDATDTNHLELEIHVIKLLAEAKLRLESYSHHVTLTHWTYARLAGIHSAHCHAHRDTQSEAYKNCSDCTCHRTEVAKASSVEVNAVDMTPLQRPNPLVIILIASSFTISK